MIIPTERAESFLNLPYRGRKNIVICAGKKLHDITTSTNCQKWQALYSVKLNQTYWSGARIKRKL